MGDDHDPDYYPGGPPTLAEIARASRLGTPAMGQSLIDSRAAQKGAEGQAVITATRIAWMALAVAVLSLAVSAVQLVVSIFGH